ncbi:MAG TPA: hypothetical protein VFM07_00910, partial [Intrasporangium sp.]|nr:hypothetical protein [Intrasporangium sp.]
MPRTSGPRAAGPALRHAQCRSSAEFLSGPTRFRIKQSKEHFMKTLRVAAVTALALAPLGVLGLPAHA